MSSHEYGPELAAEARRIAGAVQDWLDGVAARPSPAAAPEHDRGHEPDPGRGTDAQRGPDCEWCPICRLAAVLRAERPEITERLAEASAAISSALKALIDAATSHLGEHADGSEPESVTDAEPPAAPAPAPVRPRPRPFPVPPGTTP